MRKSMFFLLGAGILLSLAGCQKGTEENNDRGNAIKFNIVSGNPATRTVYSGQGTVGTDGNLTWERINWVEGDKVTIWSDYATDRLSHSKKYATYTVGKPEIKTENKESWAPVSDPVGEGLQYDETKKDVQYTFKGIYPNLTPADDGKVTFTISDEQTGTVDSENAGVLLPDMSNAVLLGQQTAAYDTDFELRMYPAYTAFEFHLVFQAYKEGAQPIKLKYMELSSENSDLAGTVEATIAAGTKNNSKGKIVGASTFGDPTETSKKITYTFPANTSLSADTPVTFTIFALPNAIDDLRVTFYYEDSNNTAVPDFRSGVLSFNKQALSFGECEKHVLKGIFVRENFETNGLIFYFEPMWEKKDLGTTTNANNVQCTQFVVGPAGTVQNAWDDRLKTPTETAAREQGLTGKDFDDAVDPIKKASRQVWEFLTDGSATINYSVMLPKTGTWRVEVCGDKGAFEVSPTSGTLNAGTSGSTKITLTITPKGESAGTIWLKTFATPTGGNEFSLDSETQLYDSRGYHKFVYNPSHEYTSNYTE